MGGCATRHAASRAPDRSELVSSPHQQEESCEQVTIRISKRRLQELLMVKEDGGREGVTAADSLLEAIVRASEPELHRRRWEPALQSIPEAAVES
jgi:hypothetical protein